MSEVIRKPPCTTFIGTRVESVATTINVWLAHHRVIIEDVLLACETTPHGPLISVQIFFHPGRSQHRLNFVGIQAPRNIFDASVAAEMLHLPHQQPIHRHLVACRRDLVQLMVFRKAGKLLGSRPPR